MKNIFVLVSYNDMFKTWDNIAYFSEKEIADKYAEKLNNDTESSEQYLVQVYLVDRFGFDIDGQLVDRQANNFNDILDKNVETLNNSYLKALENYLNQKRFNDAVAIDEYLQVIDKAHKQLKKDLGIK